ncbi:MucBP domain-containing protein [Erysipelothrix sp. HDW6C]|uniref:MucBP domain-containing protein n=1 Tax=Erysipelothrix sp. HDW6C TaxID=2714930 RepID=UPI00140BF604|nr:MucBP domain-containing protein [Erysipelothrix sp. HDW6C]QIK69073.1 MucBP domain-containing protein [Erysipelothrix sp. HDW6C]
MKCKKINTTKKAILSLMAVLSILTPTLMYADTQETDQYEERSVESIADWMPDANVQSVVAEKLGKEIAQITKADMDNIYSLDFRLLPAGTEVDLTGIEYATRIRNFDTTHVRVINMPEIAFPNYASLFVRPFEMQFMNPQNVVGNLHIGSYNNPIPSEELVGIGSLMETWTVSIFTIYSSGMRDFSTLNLPDNLSESYGMVMESEELSLSSVQRPETDDTPLLYSNDTLMDTQGIPLLSARSNSASAPMIIYEREDGTWVYLQESNGFTLTEEGIVIDALPQDVETFAIHYMPPARSFTGSINYSVRINVAVKTKGAPISVSFVDLENQPLANTQTIHGNIGESFQADAPEISNYDYVRSEGPINGTITHDPQSVTHIYERQEGMNVIVNFKDIGGNTIAPQKNLQGKIGNAFFSNPIAIDGYTFIRSENAEGLFTDMQQVVTHIYSKDIIESSVTVHFVDEDDNVIHDSIMKKGDIGIPFTAEAISIPGYQLASLEKEIQGTFIPTHQDIVFKYRPIKNEEKLPNTGVTNTKILFGYAFLTTGFILIGNQIRKKTRKA